jgi:hypothetical protein
VITDDGHEQFRLILFTVVGQAYSAAGYTLDERPSQWEGGLFRFLKRLDGGPFSGMMAGLEYQHQWFPDGKLGRFRVSLTRGALPGQALPAGMTPARRVLTGLIWGDFGIRILGDPEYWWMYETVTELGQALAESGQLTAAYGIPWLSGDLESPGR